jgi:hypothetical protein
MGNLTWNEVAQTETDKRYMDMYGLSQLDMEDMLHEDMPCMLAMSILSDAQHVMSYDQEQARRRKSRDEAISIQIGGFTVSNLRELARNGRGKARKAA